MMTPETFEDLTQDEMQQLTCDAANYLANELVETAPNDVNAADMRRYLVGVVSVLLRRVFIATLNTTDEENIAKNVTVMAGMLDTITSDLADQAIRLQLHALIDDATDFQLTVSRH